MTYDNMTGLPSMTSFFELAKSKRRELQEHGIDSAILFFDLMNLKNINHRYGFAEGNRLICSVATILAAQFGAENCAYFAQDHFAAIAPDDGLRERLEAVMAQCATANEGKTLPIRIGVYPNRIESVGIDVACDRARLAANAWRKRKKSYYAFFDIQMLEEETNRQAIIDNLDTAIEEGWINVYYQPIVRSVNGKVCDVEALARWQDPIRGMLMPSTFIPVLEESMLIHKLDLCVVRQVLNHLKVCEEAGSQTAPVSINFSRADFDACDLVSEICKLVDAAQVDRKLINIEITESVVGSDCDFMREEINRFRAQGFRVWMDDFGSGYSSLDVLQSIKFNLIKFDMGFMRKLDENEDGRIILTELMKMALALGIDTICEGVETEEQVRFLQEIGCSKLQGFFFSKPQPVDTVIEYHRNHKLTGYENPEESSYYSLLCGVNLYDVGVIAREEKTSLQNAYNTLPMCIIEVRDDRTRFARTNQSYRDFFMRFFGLDLSNVGPEFVKYDAAFMKNVVRTCCEQGIRTFYDEKMPDGSIIHSFARRIGINPVTKTTAIAIAVLSVREPNEKLMIGQILSVIEAFGEYMPGGFFIYRADEKKELVYANKAACDIYGCKDLEEFKAFTGFTFEGMIHPDDYRRISASITDQIKENQSDLDFVQYRIIRKDGEVRWLNEYGHYMKYDEQNSFYYVFISDITDKFGRKEKQR